MPCATFVTRRRFGEDVFDSGFDDVYPCFNDTLAAAHRANNPHGLFCPRSEQDAVRHLLGADCSFLPLPNALASSGFAAMMYIGELRFRGLCHWCAQFCNLIVFSCQRAIMQS
jgi:hypothetical protein